MPTEQDVARWMLSELEKQGALSQEQAVGDIERLFGSEFTYENQQGNPAISKQVLAAFRVLTGDRVVYERSEKYWRPRQPHDEPGRQQ